MFDGEEFKGFVDSLLLLRFVAAKCMQGLEEKSDRENLGYESVIC